MVSLRNQNGNCSTARIWRLESLMHFSRNLHWQNWIKEKWRVTWQRGRTKEELVSTVSEDEHSTNCSALSLHRFHHSKKMLIIRDMLVKKMEKSHCVVFVRSGNKAFQVMRGQRDVPLLSSITHYFFLRWFIHLSEGPGRKSENHLPLCKELNKDNISFLHDNPPLL